MQLWNTHDKPMAQRGFSISAAHPERGAVFVNGSITDAGKRKPYVYLILGGDYIAANFTGK